VAAAGLRVARSDIATTSTSLEKSCSIDLAAGTIKRKR
jgi:hypothetical protein